MTKFKKKASNKRRVVARSAKTAVVRKDSHTVQKGFKAADSRLVIRDKSGKLVSAAAKNIAASRLSTKRLATKSVVKAPDSAHQEQVDAFEECYEKYPDAMRALAK